MSYRGAAGAVVEVLRNADFQIATGDFHAVVGRSGTGKSTLLNLIGGLDRPSSGEVIVEGRHLEALDDQQLSSFRNKTIGYIFQGFYLRSLRSAVENVMVPLLFGQADLAEARKRAIKALRRVGLGELTDRQVRQLSGGQRQRVAIARAIVNEPKLILADEPTGNLDTATSLEIFELLRELNRENATTIVIVTHDPLVERFHIPMLTVDDGRIVCYEGKI